MLLHQNYKLVLCLIKKSRFAYMKRIGTLLFTFAAILYGCETDFDVIASYKEVMVIDGLLNANDTVQSVRISKAYLGEGNALIMAQQEDSINYGDVLDVTLQRIRQNSVLQTFSLSRQEYNDKDTGVFARKYVLYKTNQPIFEDSEYKLTVTNRETGVTATSRTKIVGDLTLVNVFSADSIDLSVNATAPYNVSFRQGQNAYYFEMIIRFNYREIDPSGNSTPKKVDWYFSSPTSINSTEGYFSFFKYNFFNNLGVNISDNPGYTRRIDSLANGLRPFEIILLEGSEDLNTYIQLQKPSSGVIQDKPLFTTIENGLGLFTSRIIHTRSLFLKQSTINAFDTSAAMVNKNFLFN